MIKLMLSLSVISVIASGCATTGSSTRTGMSWLANYREALAVTSGGHGPKKGQACTTNILGVAFGDASIETAKRVGGITTVTSVDSDVTNYVYLYGKLCTIVHGT